MKLLACLFVGLVSLISGGTNEDFGQVRRRTRVFINRLGSLIVVLSLILSGCGGSGYYFSKPGISQQQYDQDRFECMKAAQEPALITAAPGMPAGGMVQNNDMYIACFRAKGYTVQGEEEREQAVRASEQAIHSRKEIEEKKAREKAQLKLEDERRQLQAKKRALDEEKLELDQEKRRFDERRLILEGEAQTPEQQARLEEWKLQVNAYSQRVKEYNGRVNAYSQLVTNFNQRVLGTSTSQSQQYSTDSKPEVSAYEQQQAAQQAIEEERLRKWREADTKP